MLGIFSDMELGNVILLIVIIGLFIRFGGKHILSDRDGNGKGGKHGGGSSNNDEPSA